MRIPILRGRIERRILLNYRVDPEVLAAQLPAPFRPKLVRGWGIAGICLIRLAHVRPARLPAFLGMTGTIYFWSVGVLSLGFLYFAWQVSRERTKLGAKMLLHATVIYLPLVYAVMVANKVG